jgi:hypothetical protein
MGNFIGNEPATSFETVRKQVSTSNSGTTITLDHAVTNVQDILVTINAVVQSYDNYSVSGTTLTVGGTLSNDRVEILYVGRTFQSVNPSASSVGTSQLVDDAVTLAKLSATGTPSSSNYLRGDNSWASAGLSDWSENSGNLLPSNASYGIYLGVNSATATNLLHDYEEGELSNALMIDSTTQTSYSSGRANLQYTKIGRIVHCQALIDTDGQTLATTGVVKLRLPFATSDGSGTAMAGGTPFISPSVNGAIFPSRLYLDENVTSAPMNKIQSKGNGNYAEFGEQASVSNTSHRIYIHVCFSYQTDA